MVLNIYHQYSPCTVLHLGVSHAFRHLQIHYFLSHLAIPVSWSHLRFVWGRKLEVRRLGFANVKKLKHSVENFLPSMNYRNYEMILKNVQTPPYPKLPAEFLTSATSDQHHFPPPVFGRFTRVSSAPLNVFSSIALSRDCPCTLNLRLLLLLASLSGLLTPAVGVCSGLFFSSPSSSSSSN